ncbi:MAG: hypothetical protein ACSHW2_07215, partial [Parasphingopyxis sp.]
VINRVMSKPFPGWLYRHRNHDTRSRPDLVGNCVQNGLNPNIGGVLGMTSRHVDATESSV